MFTSQNFAAEIEYRSNRAKDAIQGTARDSRRGKLIRRPAVRRPADTVADSR